MGAGPTALQGQAAAAHHGGEGSPACHTLPYLWAGVFHWGSGGNRVMQGDALGVCDICG